MNGEKWVAVEPRAYDPNYLKLGLVWLFLFFLCNWCEVQWRQGNRRRVVVVGVLAFYALSRVFSFR